MQQNLFICAPSVAQQDGITALRQADSDVERMRQNYDERRKFMITRLREIGFEIKVEPQGAFMFLPMHINLRPTLIALRSMCSNMRMSTLLPVWILVREMKDMYASPMQIHWRTSKKAWNASVAIFLGPASDKLGGCLVFFLNDKDRNGRSDVGS